MTTIWSTMKDALGVGARQDPPKHPGLSQEPAIILTGHTDAVKSLTYHPSGKLISGCHDRTVRVWNIRDHTEAAKIMVHEEDVRSIGVAENGWVIVSGTSGGRVIVWDAKTCEKALELKKRHSYPVVSLAISRDSQQVASVSMDGVVMISSLTTGKTVAGPFDGYERWPISFAFSSDGERLASGATDHAVHIRDSFTGVELPHLTQHPGDRVWSMIWSLDSRQLIFGLHNGAIEFFDISNSSKLAECRADSQRVHSLAMSPDGRLLTSASTDRGTIKFWDTNTYQQIGPILSHADLVHSVAFSPDGKYLASAGNDKKIKIWDLGVVFATDSPMGSSGSLASHSRPQSPDSTPELNGGSSTAPREDVQSSNDSGNAPEDDVQSSHTTQPDVPSRDPEQNSETSSRLECLDLSAVPPPRDEVMPDLDNSFWEPTAPAGQQGGRRQMSHQFKQTKKYFKGLRRAQGDHGGTTSTGNSQNMAKEGQKELLFARKRRVLEVAHNGPPVDQARKSYLVINHQLVPAPLPGISDFNAPVPQSYTPRVDGNFSQISSDSDGVVEECSCCPFFRRIQRGEKSTIPGLQ